MALNGIWPLSLPLPLPLSETVALTAAAVVVTNGLEARSDSCHGRVRPRDVRPRDTRGAAHSDSSTTTASDGGGEIGIGP